MFPRRVEGKDSLVHPEHDLYLPSRPVVFIDVPYVQIHIGNEAYRSERHFPFTVFQAVEIVRLFPADIIAFLLCGSSQVFEKIVIEAVVPVFPLRAKKDSLFCLQRRKHGKKAKLILLLRIPSYRMEEAYLPVLELFFCLFQRNALVGDFDSSFYAEFFDEILDVDGIGKVSRIDLHGKRLFLPGIDCGKDRHVFRPFYSAFIGKAGKGIHPGIVVFQHSVDQYLRFLADRVLDSVLHESDKKVIAFAEIGKKSGERILADRTAGKENLRIAFLIPVLDLIVFDVSERRPDQGEIVDVHRILRIECLLQRVQQILSDRMGKGYASIAEKMYFACRDSFLVACLLFDVSSVDYVSDDRAVDGDPSSADVLASDSLDDHKDVRILGGLHNRVDGPLDFPDGLWNHSPTSSIVN